MPVTSSGKRVMKRMEEEYGPEEGKRVFYATINKGKKGSQKWHGKSKRKGRKRRRAL